MAYLLSLLPLLACPIVMGGMMWMMRGNNGQPADQAHQTHNAPVTQPTNGIRKSPLGGFHFCLNWKVVAGLAAVGVGVWAIAPGLVWAAIPILIVLACPLSMLFMMRGMGGGQCAADTAQGQPIGAAGAPHERLADLRAQRETIVREIAELETASTAITANPRINGVPAHERS